MSLRLVKRVRLGGGLSAYLSTRARAPGPQGSARRGYWVTLLVVFLACMFIARCT